MVGLPPWGMGVPGGGSNRLTSWDPKPAEKSQISPNPGNFINPGKLSALWRIIFELSLAQTWLEKMCWLSGPPSVLSEWRGRGWTGPLLPPPRRESPVQEIFWCKAPEKFLGLEKSDFRALFFLKNRTKCAKKLSSPVRSAVFSLEVPDPPPHRSERGGKFFFDLGKSTFCP